MASSSTVSLILFYIFWFVGNYYYNFYNKLASKEAGGPAGGMTITISVMQIVVCAAYALVLWVVGLNPAPMIGFKAPTKQPLPKVSKMDYLTLTPLTICYAFAHSAGVVALTAGSPAFGQIVKAAEPVFAAVVNTVFYGKSPSLAKWLILPIIVGGVAISTLKPNATGGYSIEYDLTALVAGSIGNMFAAFKGSENHKAMEKPGLKDRIGGIGNQFALTNVLSLVFLLPLMLVTEADKWGEFVALCKASPSFRFNVIASGMAFYLYNELATMTIKATGAVTASVANTAKRAIVIVGMAIALGNPLKFEEKVGATVAIIGVFLYSIIDELVKSSKGAAKNKPDVGSPHFASPARSTRSKTKKMQD